MPDSTANTLDQSSQPPGATPADPPSLPGGAQLMRAFLPTSPFVRHLGIELESIEPDLARLRMPFDPRLAPPTAPTHPLRRRGPR